MIKMSFGVYVTLEHEEAELPDNPDEIDAWIEEENQFVIYYEPLAHDSEYFRFWHSPARVLGLNYLSRIYSDGFTNKDAQVISLLLDELSTLRDHWRGQDYSNEEIERLEERSGYLEAAARIAIDRHALLSVS